MKIEWDPVKLKVKNCVDAARYIRTDTTTAGSWDNMPIYLPPISRRQFLVRSLAAGAGLALGPSILAAAKRTDPNSWPCSRTRIWPQIAHSFGRGINMGRSFHDCLKRTALAAEASRRDIHHGRLRLQQRGEGRLRLLTTMLEPIRKTRCRCILRWAIMMTATIFGKRCRKKKAAKKAAGR